MTVLYGECISGGNKKVGRDRKEGVRKMRCERGGMEGREVGEIGERTEKDTERERWVCGPHFHQILRSGLVAWRNAAWVLGR